MFYLGLHLSAPKNLRYRSKTPRLGENVNFSRISWTYFNSYSWPTLKKPEKYKISRSRVCAWNSDTTKKHRKIRNRFFFTFLFSLDSCETTFFFSRYRKIIRKKSWKTFFSFLSTRAVSKVSSCPWLSWARFSREAQKLNSLRLIRFISLLFDETTSTPSWLTIAEAAQAQANQKNWVRNFSSCFVVSSLCVVIFRLDFLLHTFFRHLLCSESLKFHYAQFTWKLSPVTVGCLENYDWVSRSDIQKN